MECDELLYDAHSPITQFGLFCVRQWAIGYLSVLPTERIQALPRYSNCPSKPDTLQETAGDQAPSHHRTGKNTYKVLVYINQCSVS